MNPGLMFVVMAVFVAVVLATAGCVWRYTDTPPTYKAYELRPSNER